jgi:hypothetical protein
VISSNTNLKKSMHQALKDNHARSHNWPPHSIHLLNHAS